MVTLDVDDTIVAIASPPGGGERGILRVSGPDMAVCLDQAFVAETGQSVTKLKNVSAISGKLRLDKHLSLPGRLLVWPTTRSYTRQPSAEFHTIGSTPLLHMAMATLCRTGARLAGPGEFTLRAFLSGRLDLTQAEAVLAVIDAKGQDDLRQSLDQLAGNLADPLTEIRNRLISILAELEAQLDFVEEDIEFISNENLSNQLEIASKNLQAITQQIQQRGQANQPLSAVLMGLPNAGKSSLFNCLLGQPAAIVTNVAGTTTDYVSGNIENGNVTIQLIDTAGVEHFSNSPQFESETIPAAAQRQRTRSTAKSTIRIHCIAANQPLDGALSSLPNDLASSSAATVDLIVVTQCDQPCLPEVETVVQDLQAKGFPVSWTSSEALQGIKELKTTLFAAGEKLQTPESTVLSTTILRTSESLQSAEQSVQLARQAANGQLGEELVAAEIRLALDSLGRVVGTIYTDDILDIVFGRFCIGK